MASAQTPVPTPANGGEGDDRSPTVGTGKDAAYDAALARVIAVHRSRMHSVQVGSAESAAELPPKGQTKALRVSPLVRGSGTGRTTTPRASVKPSAVLATAVQQTAVAAAAAGSQGVPALAPIGGQSFFGGPLSPVTVPQTASFVPVPAIDVAAAAAEQEEQGGWSGWKPIVKGCGFSTPSPQLQPAVVEPPVSAAVTKGLCEQIDNNELSLVDVLNEIDRADAAEAAAEAANEKAQVQQGLAERAAARAAERAERQAKDAARQKAVEKARALEEAKERLAALEATIAAARMTVAQRQEEMNAFMMTSDGQRLLWEEQGIAAQAQEEHRRTQALQQEEERAPKKPRQTLCATALSAFRAEGGILSGNEESSSERTDSCSYAGESDDGGAAANPAFSPMSAARIQGMTVPVLKAQLKKRRLPATGFKMVLQARLLEACGVAAPASDDDDGGAVEEEAPARKRVNKPRPTINSELESWIVDVIARGPRGSQITKKSGWKIETDAACVRLNIKKRADIVKLLSTLPPVDSDKDGLSARTFQQYAQGYENMLAFENAHYHDLASLSAWYESLHVSERAARTKKKQVVDFAIAHYHPGLGDTVLPVRCTEFQYFKNCGAMGLPHLAPLLALAP